MTPPIPSDGRRFRDNSNTRWWSHAYQVVQIKHSMTISLDRANYFSWRAQTIATLEGFKLLDFVTIEMDFEKSAIAKRQNRLILAWLFSSIFANILLRIANCKTSRQVWMTLESLLHRRLRRGLCGCVGSTLTTIKKGASSISSYLNCISVLANEISMLGKPMEDDDLVFMMIDGFGSRILELCNIDYNK